MNTFCTDNDIIFHVIFSEGRFKVVKEEAGWLNDVFKGSFEACLEYCEERVFEINFALAG